MLSGLERKTSWSLAEHAGEATPDGMQRLFTTARWDTGGVRDDVRGYVAAALGSPDGVLIGDDTGFEKGGSLSAGVQRQYTGTAGKITNCQLGVFLAYASAKGRALVDRELYLPRSWTGDGQRLAAAGVQEGTRFRTKPQLLEMMIERAVAAGIPFGWVTADEAYGDNGPLRSYLEGRGISYVLAVARAHSWSPLRADAARPAGRTWHGQRGTRHPLRLGAGRLGPARDLAANPEERLAAVRAGLLPLPHTGPGPAKPPGDGRGRQVGGRGVLPGCQERSRDGPLPGQALRELVPLRYPRHARPGLPYRHPGRSRRRRTRAWPARPTRSAACSPRSAHRPATSSTPATGHDGATTTKNAPAAATTSDNDCKCREPIYLSSASWGFRAS